MAGRSFKPASYLASAAQAPNRSPRQRPQFTRSASGSSVKSNLSEDSNGGVGFSLKGLTTADGDASAGNRPASPGHGSSGSWGSQRSFEDTPGRKRSQPIAIELPSKNIPKVYTPLSARGDLPGGYFPNHESPTRGYRAHPFSTQTTSPPPESPKMSTSPPMLQLNSGDSTPRMPTHILSPSLLGPLSPSIPEPLVKPRGKYHPANYKGPAVSSDITPTAGIPSASAIRAQLPPTNLTIPPTGSLKKSRKESSPTHARKTSEVQRQLEQYQKTMSAHNMAVVSSVKTVMGKKEPISPRLLPTGSPGPITPFELELHGEEGYLGARRRVVSERRDGGERGVGLGIMSGRESGSGGSDARI